VCVHGRPAAANSWRQIASCVNGRENVREPRRWEIGAEFAANGAFRRHTHGGGECYTVCYIYASQQLARQSARHFADLFGVFTLEFCNVVAQEVY